MASLIESQNYVALFKLESSSQFNYRYANIYGKPRVAYLIGRTVQVHAYLAHYHCMILL